MDIGLIRVELILHYIVWPYEYCPNYIFMCHRVKCYTNIFLKFYHVLFLPVIKLKISNIRAMTRRKWMRAPPIFATKLMSQNKTSNPINPQIIFTIMIHLLFKMIMVVYFPLFLFVNVRIKKTSYDLILLCSY